MQSVAAPSYTGQLHGLLSALYSIFLLFLPLMAVVLSGDLLAAYCRMRGETGRDCSLGDYLGSPEGWTELRSLAGKTLATYLLPLLVCGLLMLLALVPGILQPMVDIWRDSRPLGSPAALRMFTFGKWQYPWGCDINKGNHRRGGPFGIFRKAPAHKEENHP